MATVGGHTLLDCCLRPSFLHALDLRDVCRLHITSKHVSEKLIATLRADNFVNGRQILRRAVLQASAAVGPHDASQHVRAVHWLLSTASIPGQLMVEDSPGLISIPKIPSAMAKLLVSAGARITYQHLVAAARSQVEGVHVWVTAQQQLGKSEDLPHTVEAVCRYGDGGNWRAYVPLRLDLPVGLTGQIITNSQPDTFAHDMAVENHMLHTGVLPPWYHRGRRCLKSSRDLR